MYFVNCYNADLSENMIALVICLFIIESIIFKVDCERLVFKFRQRLLASNNDILICVNNHSWTRHNYMWRYLDKLLYKHAMLS